MPKRNVIWVIAILAATALIFVVVRRQPPVGQIVPRRFDRVVDVLEHVQDRYFGPIDDEALAVGAIRGMVGELDEFSSYFPPGQVRVFHRRMDGYVSGLGLRVEKTARRVEIVGVSYDSPAGRAMIRPGDELVSIGARSAREMARAEIRKALAPPVGEAAELVIRSRRGRRSVLLTSEEFHLVSVAGLHRDSRGRWVWLLDADRGLAYVRIREFVNDTPERFAQALRSIGQARGLVLDLRDNPGGKAAIAVEIADAFLSSGSIATMVDGRRRPVRYEAHPRGTIVDIPVVVLVNAATASGAELVAAALRGNDRAVVVGMPTRGKGCVQSMIDLGDDLGVMNLTTAEFIPPRGGSITRTTGSKTWGVALHERVALSAASRDVLRRLEAGARLPAPGPRATLAATRSGSSTTAIGEELLANDAQLARALELLRRPDRIKAILAAAGRRARLATLPATRGATTKPPSQGKP